MEFGGYKDDVNHIMQPCQSCKSIFFNVRIACHLAVLLLFNALVSTFSLSIERGSVKFVSASV